jgi:large repetitive protein
VDPDDGAGRPTLTLNGQARVAILRGDGSVALDAVTTDTLALPPGTALVAAQADGTTDTGDGLAGWHVRTRLSGLGSHCALGPGCVITADGIPNVNGVTWSTAGELLAGAAAVRTRFSGPVRTVAVVLETGAADRLDGLDLELRGAHRARLREGADQPPNVVLSGGQAVLIYAVEPDPEEPAVEVRVRAGGDWQITGILGGDLDVEALSSVIRSRGVAAAAGRLLAGTGAGCRLAWGDRPGNSPENTDGRRH